MENWDRYDLDFKYKEYSSDYQDFVDKCIKENLSKKEAINILVINKKERIEETRNWLLDRFHEKHQDKFNSLNKENRKVLSEEIENRLFGKINDDEFVLDYLKKLRKIDLELCFS